ncbi:hypothetical protein KAT24_01445 [Candidatus Pacearchaeota archaeon]|nr:hypothetical protein [Candidatus Pacearchaeota archaeon]
MVVENSNQQSTTGKLASGYIKTTGYTNIIGIVGAFIFGGLMILLGIILGFLFSKFSAFLIFFVVGSITILFGILGLKGSKKMREGKYYQMRKGWTTPKCL